MSQPPKSTRRQFLRGRSAVDAIQNIASSAEIEADVSAADSAAETYLVHVGRRAMACPFEIYLNAGQHAEGIELAMRALDLVEELEDQMTVYRDHSEISCINRTAEKSYVTVEPRLFELLVTAKRLSDESCGAFDITSGPLAKVWGFYRRQGSLPGGEELRDALSRVGSQWLELRPASREIHFETSRMEINLGGIGKGYALDRCAELMLHAGVEDFMIHAGHSSDIARGSRARGDCPDGGWSVGLVHPLRPDRRIAQIQLVDQALGTSGTGTQFFHHKGKRYGHILDPRTGWPADGVLSSSAVVADASRADALATAFYVMGPKRTRDYCEQHSDVAAILVCPGEGKGTVSINAINLPPDRWKQENDFQG